MKKQNFVFNPPAGAPHPYQYPVIDKKVGDLLTICPNEMLTPHWHPNSNEITTCMGGVGQVGLIYPDTTNNNESNPAFPVHQVFDFVEGQVVFLPQGYFHYFINTGSDPFLINLTFDNPEFDILSVAEVVAVLPENIKEAVAHSNYKKKPIISVPT